MKSPLPDMRNGPIEFFGTAAECEKFRRLNPGRRVVLVIELCRADPLCMEQRPCSIHEKRPREEA